jgi:hypothetical protein
MRMHLVLAARLLLASASLAAASVGGLHTDPLGRTAVRVGQTRDGIRDDVLGSCLPRPWGVTMCVAPPLDSGGFTLVDGRRSETAAWYAEGFGSQDLDIITRTPELAGGAIAVGFWMGSRLGVELATGCNLRGSNERNRLWGHVQRLIVDLNATGRPVLLRIGYDRQHRHRLATRRAVPRPRRLDRGHTARPADRRPSSGRAGAGRGAERRRQPARRCVGGLVARWRRGLDGDPRHRPAGLPRRLRYAAARRR